MEEQTSKFKKQRDESSYYRCPQSAYHYVDGVEPAVSFCPGNVHVIAQRLNRLGYVVQATINLLVCAFQPADSFFKRHILI
jgi:hypothetical protein